jgi:hypothetical protein
VALTRDGQQLHQAAVEHPEQAVGRLEEVERVLRRRRVEHDQVELGARAHLVDLLHRRVLGAARERVRDVLVDAVREDALARGGVGREARHQLVEGALHVEHHGVELARGGHPSRVSQPRADGLRLEPSADAERVGEALGRVDGEHEHAPAASGSAEPDRRREGGLADATGAYAGDHAPREQRLDGRALHAHGVSPASSVAARRPRSSGPRTPRSSSGSSTTGSAVSAPISSAKRRFRAWREARCAAHAAQARVRPRVAGSAASAGRIRQLGREGRRLHLRYDDPVERHADLPGAGG